MKSVSIQIVELDLDGSGHGLFEVPSWRLPRGSKGSRKELGRGAGVLAEIRTKHPPE
jgi:hypothetical protein